MIRCKMTFIILILTIFFMVPLSQAVTDINDHGSSAKNSSKTSIEPKASLMRVTGVIEKIQNNVLYLANNQRYNLSNVKVTDLSKSGNRVSKTKRMAEMLFINGTLKEVVIR